VVQGDPGASSLKERSGPFLALFLALCSGAVLGLSLTWPFAWAWQLLIFAFFYALVRDTCPHGFGRTLWMVGLFAFAQLCASLWWLYISLHVFGHLHPLLAASAVAVLCAFLSWPYVAGAWLWRRVSNKLGPVQQGLAWAACWALAEGMRGWMFTGFPWGMSAYAHVDGPLSGYAAWVGVYGLSFLSAGCGAWAWHQLSTTTAPRRNRLVQFLAFVFVLYTLPKALTEQEFTTPTGLLQVTLVQPALAQDEKFEPLHLQKSIRQLLTQAQAAPGALVVTPETAIPVFSQELPSEFWAAWHNKLQTQGSVALVGIPVLQPKGAYSNSMVSVGTPQPYRYDKHHLVPFGEFIPLGFRWFVQALNIPMGDFQSGPLKAPSLQVQGQRLAPTICFEDLFGEELAARFRDEAQAPTILVNASNLAWFLDSVVLPQHLQIARMRTRELGRPMVRATNTGATAIIDHRGEVLQQLPWLQPGVLHAQVQGRQGLTPYAWWVSRWGLWPLWLLLSLLLLAMGHRRQR
jgi:apolipoprotein N-acyltransferase